MKNQVAKNFFLAIGSLFFFLIFIEGFSSLALFLARGGLEIPLKIGAHHYDSALGWVNKPNYENKDYYGPGIGCKINSQGFRDDHDLASATPLNKIRIICSGDSFTFGYDVNNQDTWCHQLENLDSRVETINMGVPGYGADQAYLRYLKESPKYQHQIHLFAFIHHDFRRMHSTTYLGHNKPMLGLQDTGLVIENTPVPKRPVFLIKFLLTLKIMREQNALRSLEFFTAVHHKLRPDLPSSKKDKKNKKFNELVSRMFDDLNSLSKNNGSLLVLVYLPTHNEYFSDSLDADRLRLREESEKMGVQFIDLTPDLRSVDPTQIGSFFRDYHYSQKGHRFIAEKLFDKLKLPRVFSETTEI